MGTDDDSEENILLKEEIKGLEKGLLNFSEKNLSDAYSIFNSLYYQSENQARSKGHKYMADYAKDLIDNGKPDKWDGYFEIMIK